MEARQHKDGQNSASYNPLHGHPNTSSLDDCAIGGGSDGRDVGSHIRVPMPKKRSTAHRNLARSTALVEQCKQQIPHQLYSTMSCIFHSTVV